MSDDRAHLEELMRLVSPPVQPLDAGSLTERACIISAIKQELPNSLFLLSSVYGSGHFRQGEFSIWIHSVFRPGYPALIDYNRRIFEQEAIRDPDLYGGIFELGGYHVNRDDEWGGRIFWDTAGPLESWKIGLMHSLPSPGVQRFSLSLIEFLSEAFSNRLKPLGFPDNFDSLEFDACTTPSSAS